MSDKFEKMALEADRYIDFLASNVDVKREDLIFGLENEYDVMISESLDYIINMNLVNDFASDIISVSKTNISYIVVSRLILCKALCNDIGVKITIDKNLKYNKDDEYFKVWENAAKYIEYKSQDCIREIEFLEKSNDHTVSSAARSVLSFLRARA